MMRFFIVISLLAASLALSACGDKAEAKSAGKKTDAPAFSGAPDGNKAFSAQGWTAGDKASWEQQMRARSQGQNEYLRTN
jgi:ABC-type oligopeptide transport system substrate-binding subunit